MKALVTGATGFIGSHLVDHLVDRLLERDDTVRALVEWQRAAQQQAASE